MLEIRCTHNNGSAGECGRFLARLEAGVLILYCARCKSEQRILLMDLVLHHADEARQLERVMNEEGRLLW